MRQSTLLLLSFVGIISLLLMINYFNVASAIFFIISWGILCLAVYESIQTKHTLKRNFPLLANLRWFFEAQRDKIGQYFIESDSSGKPFNKQQRSIVYQRSKNEIETIPFGTIYDVYEKGHQFVKHTMFPTKFGLERISVGSKHCRTKYSSSLINISAMSYGSLSGAAVRALNKGAKEGKFAQNTGEGGISPYHLQGGDLIFQIGTGYFGTGRTDGGIRKFDNNSFIRNATQREVKMIELKLSQGAKPGHGGILPAKKNTEEIAKIRGVEPHTTVHSPSHHSEFNNFTEMVEFIQKLRDLSDGKPIGIKFCVTSESEIKEMIETFKDMDNYPDFITVDGSEGGTGSAPLEYTNNVGTPLLEGLNILNKHLKKHKNLKKEIKVFASGKIVDTFDIIKALSLGADGVNIARGFMMSLGCIQARECNKDTCPVGIATQNKGLEKGLVVEDKYKRVFNYHKNTLIKFEELAGSMGISKITDIKSDLVCERSIDGKIVTFKKLYG